MAHERVDLNHWMTVFSLARLRQDAREQVEATRLEEPDFYRDEDAAERHVQLLSPRGRTIVGPRDLAIVEGLRREMLTESEEAATTPVDLVVWAKGEPLERRVTKAGGLPYLPLAHGWPQDEAGACLRFIAQLSFVDSLDLLPDLPGDVLLIFGEHKDLCLQPDKLRFLWVQSGDQPLFMEVPESARREPVAPFYGHLHRSVDLPSRARLWGERYRDGSKVAVFEGTKLGGVPYWIQHPAARGRFIGSLGSINTLAFWSWPFINVSESEKWDPRDGHLMIADMGCLFIFINEAGEIEPVTQYY